VSGAAPTVPCPLGHASTDDVVCSVCGTVILTPDAGRSLDTGSGPALPVPGPDRPLRPLGGDDPGAPTQPPPLPTTSVPSVQVGSPLSRPGGSRSQPSSPVPRAAGSIGSVGSIGSINSVATTGLPGSGGPGAGSSASGPGAAGWTCSNCSAELDAGTRFCEVCGYDPTTGSLPEASAPVVRPAMDLSPASSETWSGRMSAPSVPSRPSFATGPRTSAPPSGLVAVITADQAYFDNLGVEGVPFPFGVPARTIELPAEPVSIGRRSRSRGTNPVIDLGGPPEDPAVSHTHASLIPAEDGTWRLVDHGSTNGTYLNEAPEPVPANRPLPVSVGDRIYVGAWTRIVLETL
jgi:hypothetical protein